MKENALKTVFLPANLVVTNWFSAFIPGVIFEILDCANYFF